MGASLESSRPIMAPSVSLLPLLQPFSSLYPNIATSFAPHPPSPTNNIADHVVPREGYLEAHLCSLQHLQRSPLRCQHRQDNPLLRLSPARNQGHREWPPQAREQEASHPTLRAHKREDRTSKQSGIGSQTGTCSRQEDGRTGRCDAGSQEARVGREDHGEREAGCGINEHTLHATARSLPLCGITSGAGYLWERSHSREEEYGGDGPLVMI